MICGEISFLKMAANLFVLDVCGEFLFCKNVVCR